KELRINRHTIFPQLVADLYFQILPQVVEELQFAGYKERRTVLHSGWKSRTVLPHRAFPDANHGSVWRRTYCHTYCPLAFLRCLCQVPSNSEATHYLLLSPP